MQAVPPILVAPILPVADRLQGDLAIKAPAQPGASGSQGETTNSDAESSALASDRAKEIARVINGRSESEVPEEDWIIQGFPPLDTREVGDRDVIDPDRPAVRGPEPIIGAEAQPLPLPGMPEAETSPEAGGEDAKIVELPGAARSDTADRAEAKEDRAEQAEPATPQPVKAATGPASPGASAPDVPEPPAPGAVDIRR